MNVWKIGFLLTFFFKLPLLAHPFDQLSMEEQEKLNRGELVVREEDPKKATKSKEKSPWPVRELFFLLEGTPLENFALFSTFEYQPAYVLNLLKAEVIKDLPPGEVVVDYTMQTPWPLKNAQYISNHRLKHEKGSYTIEWSQVKSNTTIDQHGQAIFFSPKGSKKTFFYYKSFIYPDSILAPMVKSQALKELVKSISSMLNHFVKVREKRELIQLLVKMTEERLNGRAVSKINLTKLQQILQRE